MKTLKAFSHPVLPKSPLRTGRTQAGVWCAYTVTERLVADPLVWKLLAQRLRISPRKNFWGGDRFRAKISGVAKKAAR
ncbi:MAG: hypothetical protein HC858_11430 [Brachymonas sp.]|nr:hypothetical protein [Brachymonas sp.]